MRKLSLICFATFAFIFGSCQKSDQGSDAQFSIIGANNGAFSRQNLWNHLKVTPKLRVCLAMIGYEPSELNVEAEKVKKLAEFGVLGWLSMLKGHRSWNNETIGLDFKVQTEFCENADRAPFNQDQVVLKLHWYKTDVLFQQKACANWPKIQGACRSHAILPNLKISAFFDPKLWPIGTDKLYVAHEFGHMLGLGDTYSTPNFSEPVNQPLSVMNIGSKDFTEDDSLGLWAAFEIAMGRPRSCGPGASEGAVKANVEKSLFCLADAKAIINHGPGRNDNGPK